MEPPRTTGGRRGRFRRRAPWRIKRHRTGGRLISTTHRYRLATVLPGAITVLATTPSTRGRRHWQAFAGASLVAVGLSVADLSPLVSTLAFALIGTGTIWASFTGPRRFGAEPRVAWRLIGVAALLFLIGVVVRPWASRQSLPFSLLSDAATIPGYVLVGIILIILLRARQSVERHAALDGLIV